MQKETDQWFTSWFNTPYYHKLYQDRDYSEAVDFMEALTDYLDLRPGNSILDLACGKGRHAVSLNRMGFEVTGVDLSPSSIESAKKYENHNLHFEVHDMCLPYPKKFDAVFNLFTSFGYFEKKEDNLRTIRAIKDELKQDGFAVIDFLNTEYVVQNLVPSEVKLIDGTEFRIKRTIKDDYILKTIQFEVNRIPKTYVEKVRALTLEDFKAYFNIAGLKLINTFGDYKLNPFDKNNSERLILIFN